MKPINAMVLSLCDTSTVLRELFKGQNLKAEGSARLPARTAQVHVLFLPCCPKQQGLSCLPHSGRARLIKTH